ncbi:MAG: MurR/RpiR family transcriptional regulator [Saccharospirillum sp.]|uniref:MurR/RpiR family transcriptional regulator n=1 Tax=Saccharospirillum sp. TaxID=2033801 RepID=UPI0034A09EDA
MSELQHNRSNGELPAGLTVAELIHRKLDSLTPSERKVARLLLTNYPVLGLDSLARFAEKAEVSHPTILRFVSKLGISGYPRFQEQLRDELNARLKSPLAKSQPEIRATPGKRDFQERYTEAVCQNIRHSMDSIPAAEFDSILALLGDTTQSVFLLGGRFTDSIATHTYMHLRALRAKVSHVTGLPVSWSEYLLDMDKTCVLLVFDIRRYQQEVVVFAEEAQRRGAQVVLVTDQWLSPISRFAQHVLVAHVEAPSNWDSLTAINVMMETFIAALSNRSWGQLEDRIGDLEYIRSLFKSDDTDRS